MQWFTFLAAGVVLATIVARGNDHPTRPAEPGLMPLIRLHIEKLALLLVGATAGSVMLTVLAGKPTPWQVDGLVAGSALWMLTHPRGWWAFVVQGRTDECQTLRPDP